MANNWTYMYNSTLTMSDPSQYYNSTVHEHTLDALQYYTVLFKVVSVTIAVVIFLVGFLGNVLVVVVVLQTKSMHTPTNCYLISLSVADCLVLLSATLPAVPEPFYQVSFFIFTGCLVV